MNRRTAGRWRQGWDVGNVALTPPYILDAVRRAFGVAELGTDPCTEPDNPTAARTFYALPDDGMAHPWIDGPVWVNPPYGAAAYGWAIRAIETGQAGTPCAILLPAHTETATGSAIMRGAELVTFLDHRPSFGRRDGKPYRLTTGSLIALWGVVDPAPLRELGAVMRPA